MIWLGSCSPAGHSPEPLIVSTPPPTEAAKGPAPELHHNVLGLFDSVAQSVSTMAPTASAVMTIPLVFGSAGNGTWVSYLLATGCTLIVALCIARFAKDSSSPGSLYVYATSSLPPFLGSAAAWALLMAYVASGASVVGGFMHYGNVVLGEFLGFTLPTLVLALVVLAIATWVAYRDVKVSARLMLYIELGSVLMISTVFALILWQHGLHVDVSQFTLKDVHPSGVRLGLVLAMFSLVGFESATTLGEEVRNPLKTIPKAIILSALCSGVFFMMAAYTEVLAFPASAGPLDQSEAPLSVLATVAGVRRLGPVIDICALITMLACTLACATAASRVLLLMGRRGLVPLRLSGIHARNGTPHMAVLATGAAMFVLSVPFALGKVSGETLYDWMGSLSTYGFIAAYALVAVALPIYLRRRQSLTAASVVLSSLAVAAMILVLAGTLYPVPEAPKNWLPYLFLAYILGAAGWNSWQARRAPAGLVPAQAAD